MIYLIYLKYLFSGHHNPHPEDWPANSSIQTNSRVKIGNFLLGSSVKEKFTEFKPFTSGERPRVEGIKIYAGVSFFKRIFKSLFYKKFVSFACKHFLFVHLFKNTYFFILFIVRNISLFWPSIISFFSHVRLRTKRGPIGYLMLFDPNKPTENPKILICLSINKLIFYFRFILSQC